MPFLMILAIVLGGIVTFVGVIGLVADTVGHFLISVAILAVGLALLYSALRLSRALEKRG